MARVFALLALVIAVLSLALNLLIIDRLDKGRIAVIEMLDHASSRLDSLSDVSIEQSFHISRSVSFSGEFPVNQQFTYPVSMTVPIDNSINVNVTTPLGPMNMPVTVKTSFPVKMQVPVTISMTIPYSVTVPIDLNIPISIKLRDLGIDPAIKEAHDQLQLLRQAVQ